MRSWLRLMMLLIMLGTASGCAMLFGAGAAGGAYEYKNKRQLDELDKELNEGTISQEEYLKRKKQINEGSIIY